MKVQVARIGKPHGIRGEVTVQLFTDDPQGRCAPGAVLQLEAATEQAARLAPTGTLEISSARWNKSVMVLGFTSVKDRNAAELLRESRLWAESEDDDQDDDAWYEHELLGLDIVLAAELERAEAEGREPAAVGRVTGLRTLPAQDLLELELADGQEGMVPFVEQIVLEVDPDAARVVIDPPPGLLDLEASQGTEGEAAERAAETGEPADLSGVELPGQTQDQRP